jgi:tetratricopeptide (TPR) repeat protein
MTGDLLGTLRYMSPEQALAQRAGIDHRTDLYSLGATWYELLTLRPVFGGRNRQELLRQIAFEEPRPPRQHNPAVPVELETIVLKALEKNPADRYATAAELGADLRRFLDDQPIQARRPSLVQRARKWGRRHQAVVWSAALIALILAAGLGWITRDWRARRMEAEGRAVEALAIAELRLREGNPYDPQLVSAARTAEAQLTSGVVRAELRQQVNQALADLAMLGELEQIRLSQARVTKGHFDIAGADAAYAQAFRSYGIDVEGLAVPEAGARIRARTIGTQLAAALDAWALARREHEWQGSAKGSQSAQAGSTWTRLLEVAQAADPDPWRGSLRQALATDQKGGPELQKLVAGAPYEELPPSTLALLGVVLREAGALSLAEQALREGQQRHPADFWINQNLAFLLENEVRPPQLDEAIACYRVAVALRPLSPGVHLNLGTALQSKGQLDKAIAAFREAKRLDRDYAEAYLALGGAWQRKGQLDQAMAEYRTALRIRPDFPLVHNNLGLVLEAKGDRAGAIQHYREALRLNKELPEAHNNLGNALRDQGDVAGAIKHYQEALRLQDDFFEAHSNLAQALASQGQWDQAIAEHRKALQLQPAEAQEHRLLAEALNNKGLLDEAGAEYREAIRLAPQDADNHAGLGAVLGTQGKLTEAIACFRKAIALKPTQWKAHNDLGTALRLQGDLNGAIEHHREAIRIKPDYAEAYSSVGAELAGQGKFAEAIASIRKTVGLQPDDPGGHNNLAWMLATCPDPKFRDPGEAVQHAKKVTELAPGIWIGWTTLGVAQYRNGDWKAALDALTKSRQLRRGDDGTDFCFLAMAHWQLGEKDKARTWYDRAVAWMDKHKPHDEELRRFRAEAAELLGIPKAAQVRKETK